MKFLFLSLISCTALILLTDCSTIKLEKSFDKVYAVNIYQQVSQVDEAVTMPLNEEFYASYLESGEDKELWIVKKNDKISKTKENHLLAILARDKRPISKQIINIESSYSNGVNVTTLLENVKAGDRLILASVDGKTVYKITQFI